MGMFDSLLVECPNLQCDGIVEFQSKAHNCNLVTYNIINVPVEIAADLQDSSERCPKCNNNIYLHVQIMHTVKPYINSPYIK